MTQKEKHMAAFENFAARFKDKSNVIGFLIYGSLAYGTVTKDSDLDLVVFVQDGSLIDSKSTWVDICANEDDVEIHAGFIQVSVFKKRMQRMIAGDWTLSQYSKGILMHCKDESLKKFIDDARKVGKNDAALGIIRDLGYIVIDMERANKWITTLDDTLYAQQFLQRISLPVAEIIMLLNGEHPDRESKLRAMELNAGIMEEVYVKPGTTVMTKEEITGTLQILDDFIMEYMPLWSKPLIAYLSDEEGKTAQQCHEYFGFELDVLGYMVKKGIIEKRARLTRIFRNSKLTLEEPAYVYIQKEAAV